jgi:hypothetical protein
MNQYEREAWESLRALIAKRTQKKSLVPAKLQGVAQRAGDKVSSTWDKVPGADNLEGALLKAMEGLKDVALDTAMASVSEKHVINRYVKEGCPITSIADIRKLDLEQIDRVMPKLNLRYSAAAATEGAVAGLAITGGEALAAVGSVFGVGVGAAPGAGTIVGAMAFDAATIVAASARAAAHVGTFYGYEVRNPEEELFALSAMNFSNSGSQAAKLMAFQQLSKVTQQLVRRATWTQLNQHAIVRVITQLFTKLGLRVTQRKIGQAVPVLGVVIGAGLNASYLQTITRDAELAYRMRFLAEKHDLDTSTLAPKPTAAEASAAAGEFVDIEEIIDAELVNESDANGEQQEQ